MINKIQRWSNSFINIFLVVFIALAVLSSSAKVLPYFNELGPSSVYLIDLCIVAIVIIFLLRKNLKKPIAHFHETISNNTKLLYIFAFILIISWQFYVVNSINGKTMWDANMILSRVADFDNMKALTNEYLSVYPNNVLLFLYERGIWFIFGKPGLVDLTLILSSINIFLVDFSIILGGRSLKKIFNTRIANIFLISELFLMALSPWIAVPYSDIWAFFFSSMSMCLSIEIFSVKSQKKQIIFAILLGMVITCSYFIKPSLIIFYIAVGIVTLLSFFAKKKRFTLLTLLTVLLTSILLIFSFSSYQKNISWLNLNDNRAFSMMHFAAMGAINKGAYNPQDYLADKAIKNPEKRNRRDTKAFVRRIKGYKNFANYQRFLVRKHSLNTADGTFNWSGNGIKVIFDRRNDLPQKLFTTKTVNFTKNTPFSFPVQIVWVATLTLILFSLPNKRLFTQILKYSIVGFFLFLLIFEGGKSRYMIQLLPFLCALASIGGNELTIRIRVLLGSLYTK
ncbi:hypothetical protein ACI3EJ_02305 [Ligilactobacillus acidipiscis]|uniref:hypothetical protein n=1 Tax=Ligilactobacillus acidipiscis TaxID=89059 RepID=UPI00386A0EC0